MDSCQDLNQYNQEGWVNFDLSLILFDGALQQ